MIVLFFTIIDIEPPASSVGSWKFHDPPRKDIEEEEEEEEKNKKNKKKQQHFFGYWSTN